MKAEFIKRVMQIMNETDWNPDAEDVFIGADTVRVEMHIESVFRDAWRKATALFPKHYFDVCDFSGRQLVGDRGSGTGYVVLPDDFYMLSWFQMQGWSRGVDTLYENSGALASVQSDPYARGNAVRPVCVRSMRNTPAGWQEVIEYYSLPPGAAHWIQEARYVPLIRPLADEPRVGEKLFAPLAYLCAGLVFSLFEKPEMAALLDAKAVETGSQPAF